MARKFALALSVVAALTASAAVASRQDPAVAVRSLEAAAQLAPHDGGTAIELAAAYQRAGRMADANTTFRRALTLDNAMLETPTGDSVWSYQVARRALSRDVALTAR